MHRRQHHPDHAGRPIELRLLGDPDLVEYKNSIDAALEPLRMQTLKDEQYLLQDREPQSILTPLGYWLCFTVREIPEIPGWDRAAAIAEEDKVIHDGLVMRGVIPP